MEAVVAHFEHVAGVLLLFLLVLVQRGTGFYEFLRTGCGRAVGYDIKVIDSNTVGAYPFEDMADGPDVKRRLAARDVEMVNMPDMPQQVAYMFQRDIHGLGISSHAVGTAHVAAPGNLDTKIFNIEFFHEMFYRFSTNSQKASKSAPVCKSLAGTLRISPLS